MVPNNFWKLVAKSAAVIAIATFAVAGNARLAAAQQWTPWMDRDNPSGVGDFETVTGFTPPPCNGHPAQIQCRFVKTKAPVTDNMNGGQYHCNLNGGWCANGTPPGTTCQDIEVRFSCSNCKENETESTIPGSDAKYCCNPKLGGPKFCCTQERTQRDERMTPVPEQHE
jgi:hypothetical protein